MKTLNKAEFYGVAWFWLTDIQKTKAKVYSLNLDRMYMQYLKDPDGLAWVWVKETYKKLTKKEVQ